MKKILFIPPHFYETTFFWLVILGAVTLLVFTVLLLYIRNIRLQNRNKLQLLKLVSLQGRLNPHFIANMLSVINALLYEDDKKMASWYIREVSRLLRNMSRYIGKDFMPFFMEIELVDSYLKAEQLRTESAFQFEVVTAGFSLFDYSIVPFMTHSFLENAVKNVSSQAEAKSGIIKVSFEMNSKPYVVCRIEDNGPENLMRRTEQGQNNLLTGEEIIRERLFLYNALNRTRLKLEITDPIPGIPAQGTVVKIEIPVKKNN